MAPAAETTKMMTTNAAADKNKDGKKKKTKKDDDSAAVAEESAMAPYPDMSLCQKMHRLTSTVHSPSNLSNPTRIELEIEVFEQIAVELGNPSLYRKLQAQLYRTPEGGTGGDNDIMDTSVGTSSAVKLTSDNIKDMETKVASVMADLEKKVEEAKENAGDMEILQGKLDLAREAAKSGSEADALGRYQDVLDLPKLSSGKKMDALLEQARVASFYGDVPAADRYLDSAQKLLESSSGKGGEGGDWERRNRLKVYKALQQLLHRDFEASSKLFLEGIATFSCNEICSYSEFIVYACLTNLLHLPRPQLKTKIIDGPEILSVAKDIPVVIALVRAFYDCDYKAYLKSMVDLEAVLKRDRYLYPHCAYWMRELHILAYKQFLDAYQSVTLDAMASAFGVSPEFIDYHASRFIASNRLSAKIDKYGGVIETNRPDYKNAQYREMIQKGDLLLNRIQKLARVVDL